jgi:hypothetical protein
VNPHGVDAAMIRAPELYREHLALEIVGPRAPCDLLYA